MHNELSEAVAFRETGQYKEAQNWLRAFLRNHPAHPEAWSLLSQILMLNKNDGEAEAALLKALKIKPTLASAQRNHARLLLKQSKPNKALEIVNAEPFQSSNDPEDWLVMATCLGANQKEQDALQLLNKVINTQPNYAEAFANRAVLRLRMSDINGALADATTTLTIKPHMSQIWALLGYLHQLNKNLPDAIKSLRKAHQLVPTNAEHMVNLGEFLRQQDNLTEAISYLEKATKLAPVNITAWTSLGQAFQQLQKIPEAQTSFEKGLAIDPNSPTLLTHLGTIAVISKNWVSALAYFQRALAITPDVADILNSLGFVLHNQNRLQEAKDYYEQAIKLNPKYLQAHLNLGNIFSSLKKLEQAEICYKNVLTLELNNVEALNNLGNVLKDLNIYSEAETCYRKAIELQPNYAEIHNNLGTVLKALGKLKQAESSFTKALNINPNSAECLNNLAITMKELGDFKGSETYFRSAIKLQPDNTDLYSNLANVLQDVGKLIEAEQCYKKAVQLEPNNSNANFNLGYFLLGIKEFEQAIGYFKLSKLDKSRYFLLRCFYILNKEADFYEQLGYSVDKNEIHPMLGSIGCRAALKFGKNTTNLFCQDPIIYVSKINLKESYDFNRAVVKSTKTILDQKHITEKKQALLKNGYQTYGNIFDVEPELTKEIQKIIHLELKKYRIQFEKSKEGLITHWPKEYTLYGWLINMKSGGSLKAHMHEQGWISGSIYINIPPKSKVDSGNLVVCIEDETIVNTKENQTKSIDVVTGSMCLFPASLLHYTVPFEADEERIVLAFDVVPNS